MEIHEKNDSISERFNTLLLPSFFRDFLAGWSRGTTFSSRPVAKATKNSPRQTPDDNMTSFHARNSRSPKFAISCINRPALPFETWSIDNSFYHSHIGEKCDGKHRTNKLEYALSFVTWTVWENGLNGWKSQQPWLLKLLTFSFCPFFIRYFIISCIILGNAKISLVMFLTIFSFRYARQEEYY